MKNPYGYLVFDMNPSSADLYRLRTHIFPERIPTCHIYPQEDVMSSHLSYECQDV